MLISLLQMKNSTNISSNVLKKYELYLVKSDFNLVFYDKELSLFTKSEKQSILEKKMSFIKHSSTFY